MTPTEEILRETQLFTWLLTLHGQTFENFIAMPMERQIATAAAYGLSPRGLEIALGQIVRYIANRNELLTHIAERQAKAAH